MANCRCCYDMSKKVKKFLIDIPQEQVIIVLVNVCQSSSHVSKQLT